MSDNAMDPVLTGAELERYLTDVDSATVEDPKDVERRILENILKAENAADILKGGTLKKATDVLGRHLQLLDVRFNRSRFEGQEGAYAVLDAADVSSGEKLQIGCSARKVMVKAYKLQRDGYLPTHVQLVRSEKPTANGYYVIDLIPA